MEIIDSHCHIDRVDLDAFGGSIESMLKHASELSVKKFLCVCIDLEHFDQVHDLALAHSNIYSSVGVHPTETNCKDPTTEELLEYATSDRIIAIGETGLDYFHVKEDQADWQRDRFRRHIKASNISGKPLIIHTREAKSDTIKILSEEKAESAVMHCFSEDWETAKAALDLGYYISFSGILTFKSAQSLRDVAKKIPAERLLVETDSPYLTPVPNRGRPNSPAYTYYVAEKLAEIRNTSISEIAKVTTDNFNRLFFRDFMTTHDAPRYITVDEFSIGQRLDNYLIKQLKGVPKSRIYRIIRKGEVRVNKGRKKADYKLVSEDIIRIPPIRTSTEKDIKPSDGLLKLLNSSILYEDKGLLVLNKTHGMAVHGGSGVTIGIIEALKSQYKEPIELVHRLDRGTSGCLILAKKRSVLKSFHEQLVHHQVEKRYIALVKNSWSKKKHTIDAPIYQNSRNSVIDSKGKDSVSHFHPIKNFLMDDESASLVEVVIETGRTHQIRVHAKHAGHPVAQDDKYGDNSFDQLMKKKGLSRLFLHAKSIVFTNPITNEIQKVTAPLPNDLEEFLNKL